MLYCYIQNITGNGKLARPDGKADYRVAVQINSLQLAEFEIKNFPRNAGWAKLFERVGQVGQLYDDRGNEWLKVVVAAQEAANGKSKAIKRATRRSKRS